MPLMDVLPPLAAGQRLIPPFVTFFISKFLPKVPNAPAPLEIISAVNNACPTLFPIFDVSRLTNPLNNSDFEFSDKGLSLPKY